MILTEQDIENHITKVALLNYEERLKEEENFPQAFDQKIQADILEIISECILHYSKENPVFSTKDLWHYSYSVDIFEKVFKKGSPLNPEKKSEWDKVFAQPLCMLSFFGILFRTKPKKGQVKNARFVYTIINPDILKFISRNSRNSSNFIYVCAKLFCKANNLEDSFEKFFSFQDKKSFSSLKKNFEEQMKYLSRNRKQPLEDKKNIHRIFTKVLNSQAYYYDKLGTKRGNLSKDRIQLADLLYNQPNFYDKLTDKPRSISRKEWEKDRVSKYDEQKSIHGAESLAKIKIKRRHNDVSEYSYKKNAIHVHHIFPRHEFLKICYYKENLIVLTPDEHLIKAHPDGKTKEICEEFQLELLLCKLKSIIISYEAEDNFYSLKDFISLINIGFNIELPSNCNVSDLERFLENRKINYEK